MNEEIIRTPIEISIDTIIEPAEVRVVIEEAKDRLKAEDARFRLRSWDDRSVVYVPTWIMGPALGASEAELSERVYFDPEDPSRVDCIVGLVARIARIKEEEMKEDKNEDLLRKLRKGIEDRIDKIGICFNDPKKEKEFIDLNERFKTKIKNLQTKKENWEKYLQHLKEFQDTNSFFNEAFSDNNKPWKHEKNPEEKEKQWEQLRKYLEMWKRGSEIREFLNAVEQTYERYSLLHEQYIEYASYNEKRKYEIVVPVVVFGKFIGVLNFHRRKKEFTVEDENLAKIYAMRLATTYLHWQAELFEKFQEVARMITAEHNFEIIASMINEGIRTGLRFGLQQHRVFPLLYIPRRPIDEFADLSNKDFIEIWEKIWKDSYQKRSESEDVTETRLREIEEKLGPIPIRVDGLGGTIINRWAKKVRDNEFLEAKDQFITCLDVDNPNSTCGSRSALYHNIKATGCISLIFNDKVYGLLYLHCDVRHFFTEVEFRALKAFCTQAAIAISNAELTGDSYEQLYGTELLKLLIRGEQK
jgi:hypothetical protein